MARSRIQGRDLMVFDENGHSFAFATNCSLTVSTAMNEINDKDTGAWGATEPGKMTWNITTEHIYDVQSYASSYTSFYTMFDWQQDGSKKKIYFGLKKDYKGSAGYDADDCVNDPSSAYTYWTPDTTQTMLTGYCFLTDLSVNASATDTANYSCTLQGSGPLSKVNYS